MESKPVHTLVLDTGALIGNEPSVSTLLAQSESLVTAPEIISEIKDAVTRLRVEITLTPFLTLRSPNPASIKFVTDFAQRTGDLAVLSKPDIKIIALTYEIECERNGGDWRLRRVPGQKALNGRPPLTTPSATETGAQPTPNVATATDKAAKSEDNGEEPLDPIGLSETESRTDLATSGGTSHTADTVAALSWFGTEGSNNVEAGTTETALSEKFTEITIAGNALEKRQDLAPKVDFVQDSSSIAGDSDSEGWITPSNLKKKQAEEIGAWTTESTEPMKMQVAVLTTDFAMQNVILQMNLNLLSQSLNRVKHLKTFVLRCHGCFQVTKRMDKQFCPRCGNPTLTRVACSTTARGDFKLHLKKNMQWSHRGNRYSIPKTVHGSANGKLKGGGKDGWGSGLILAEDQKEYQRALVREKRTKDRNLMDEDYLPSILTGERGRAGGRLKVGAGRNVNARKR